MVREVSRCRAEAEHSIELCLGFSYCSTLPPPGGLELCRLAAQTRLLGEHKNQQGAPLQAGARSGNRGASAGLLKE